MGKSAIAHLHRFQFLKIGFWVTKSVQNLLKSHFPPSVGHRIGGFLAFMDVAIHCDQRAFIEEVKTKSDFESPIQTEPGDRLIALSTCAYAFENARYILIGRLVPAEQCAADISDTEE